MKARVYFAFVAGSALCALVFLAAARPAATAQDQVQQWEHLALSHDDAGLGGELSAQIVRLGKEGWELVGVTPIEKNGTTIKTRYYFKRPK